MANNPDIRILVGTEGAGNVDGASGKLIQEELRKIARGIKGDKMPKVKFTVDISSTQTEIVKQLNQITKNIKVNPIKINIDNSSAVKAKKKITDDLSQYIGSGQAVKEFDKYYKKIRLMGSSTGSSQGITEKFNKYEKQLENVQKLINDNTNDKGAIVPTDQLKTEINKLESLKQKFIEVYQAKKNQASVEIVTDKNKTDLKNLYNELERYAQANNRLFEDENLSSRYQAMLKEVGEKSKDKYKPAISNAEVKKVRGQLAEFRKDVKAADLEGQTFFSRFSSQAQKLGVYLSASAIIMGTVRQIRQMTNNVIQLDGAMTELKKVTDETDATYEKFLKNAETRAKNLGATLTDTVTATADFARLGYALQDAEKIADASLVYKNVGD